MNVADLEFCKELYELSGWHKTDFYYDAENQVSTREIALSMHPTNNCPAYDLGYLLRKLPPDFQTGYLTLAGPARNDEHWVAGYSDFDPFAYMRVEADTPENAACKLAIELFKREVIKP